LIWINHGFERNCPTGLIGLLPVLFAAGKLCRLNRQALIKTGAGQPLTEARPARLSKPIMTLSPMKPGVRSASMERVNRIAMP
jgi:hypothetical protein